MDDVDRRIVNALQDGVAVVAEPFDAVAEALDVGIDDLLLRLERLLDQGWLTRFGPMYDAERLGGGAVLAAMAVPESTFEAVAAKVNAHPEVAHNYERAHRLNMWFVIATDMPAQIEPVVRAIEAETGLRVYVMPKLDEFFIGVRFEV
jgi:DNA-binding Lrp family transcriptional regulator